MKNRHILLVLPYHLLFWRLYVYSNMNICPLSIPEQSGSLNCSEVLWQTESGSEAQKLLGTPLGVVAASHRFLRGCRICFYHGPLATAPGNSVQCDAGGCMKPLLLMSVLFRVLIQPPLMSLVQMWQGGRQTLSFSMNMCILVSQL